MPDAGFKMTLYGEEELLAAFRRAPGVVLDGAAKGVFASALDVVNAAKHLVPVDTGRLKGSINAKPVQKDLDGVRAVVGTDVDYAYFVETGKGHSGIDLPQPAQPYLLPALESKQQETQLRVSRYIRAALNRIGR